MCNRCVAAIVAAWSAPPSAAPSSSTATPPRCGTWSPTPRSSAPGSVRTSTSTCGSAARAASSTTTASRATCGVTELIAGERLAFTWWPDGDDGATSDVIFTVEETDTGSRLVITETADGTSWLDAAPGRRGSCRSGCRSARWPGCDGSARSPLRRPGRPHPPLPAPAPRPGRAGHGQPPGRRPAHDPPGRGQAPAGAWSRRAWRCPERRGREVRYRAVPEPLVDAVRWLVAAGAQWDQRLDRLERATRRDGRRSAVP